MNLAVLETYDFQMPIEHDVFDVFGSSLATTGVQTPIFIESGDPLKTLQYFFVLRVRVLGGSEVLLET